MSYINCTLDMRQVAFLGDEISECHLGIFADSNFAERADSKSTSGGFLAFCGPYSFFPLAKFSRKQGSAANSTPEAELVAMNEVVRTEAIPMLGLVETTTDGTTIKATVYEDNQATARIVKTGKFRTMSHVKRVHGCKLSLLND